MKNNILLILVFVSGAVFGAAGMFAWNKTHTPAPVTIVRPAQTDLLLAQLEEAGLPQGVQEAQSDKPALKNASELPSQLVRAELPEGVMLGIPAKEKEESGAGAMVIPQDAVSTVVLNTKQPTVQAQDGSGLTMIDAPVAAKRIQSLDEYKAFKQTARGSYPTVDFAKEEVLVLESQSNLPDKVFEIVSVEEQEGKLHVTYRVNVLGLDKKINTYSAQKITKSSLPVELEQVL